MSFVRLINIAECHQDRGTFVEKDGRELAVFLLEGGSEVRVIDNTCPHANGNLAGGDVEDGVVECPWHAWQFDLNTGVCTHSEKVRVHRYPVQIRNGSVWVDLEGNAGA